MFEAHEYPRFSPTEIARRRTAMRERMARADLDALVVFGGGGPMGGSMVQYLTNWLVTFEAFLLFPRDGDDLAMWVHFINHVPLARRLSAVPEVRWRGVDPAETIAAEIRRRGLAGRRVGLAGNLPFTTYEGIRARLSDTTFVPFGSAFMELFLVKSEEELAWARRGAELTDLAMEALERELRPGLTENDLAAIVQGAYLRHGGRNVIHFLGSTSMREPDTCLPAQWESERVLRRGDILLTEITAHFWGYGGQSLRPYAIGEEPTPEYHRLFEVAEQAFYAISKVMRTGATAHEVMAAADVIEDSGYTIYDDLVHGMNNGYLPPVLRTRGTMVEPLPVDFRYPENSLWVIQPNVITKDERMGVQFGDMVRVTTAGAERMQRYPLRFVVV